MKKAEKPAKILLIDDRPENLLALEVILTDKNYELVNATSGKEALKILLREQDFALILMDALMPIMDGFETATLIRQSEKLKYIPIIFLTAQMNAADNIFKGYRAGAVDYMLKPLSKEILKAKVAVFVDLYRKNNELRVQAEHMKMLNSQLLQQSQYVRSLIEASLDPLITINAEGKITDMNYAWEHITGIPRQQIINSDFFNYFTEPEKARKIYKEVFEKGSIVDFFLTLQHKDGTLIEVLFNGSVYKDDKGNVLGVVVVAREKLLSKYARTILEASLDPLITIDSGGKITDVNHAMEVISGSSRDAITGSAFSDYFTDPDNAKKVYEEVFAKGFAVGSPLTLQNRQGALTEVLFNGSVYKDNRGNILGAVIVARDVTAQKRVEKELREAKSNAEQARKIAEDGEKAKQQFLANMSHEIRTPMNAIIGFTKVILKTNLDEKQKEYLNAIKVSGDSLVMLINDILDLAKVDAGKMTFEAIPFQLAKSISSMLFLFETTLKENKLTLVRHYDASIPDVLVGDPGRLQQIIINLLSNAVKFTKEGKITVSVRLIHQDDANANIQFSVADTGIGIPEDQMEKIFDNFQQATSKTTRLFGGTGLGLAIVKRLVKAQQGTLTLTSKVGEGSTFSFILNFKKTTLRKTDIETESGLELKTKIKNVKILVAEDVKLNQLLMKAMLEAFGFEMHLAENGKMVIEKLQKNTYDLILMDLQMPGMDGFEAAEYIRNNMNSDIPIIALTADVTSVDVEKCRNVGMDDYISKPVEEKILYNKIIEHVQKNNPSRVTKSQEESQERSKACQENKCTNLDFVHRMTKGNSEMIKEMISVYLEETPKFINKMKQGINNMDWELLSRSAHSFLPSFSTMGISKEFATMAEKISDYAEKKENFEKIKILFLKIEQICSKACEELERELTSLEKY